jgi:hypothetical protein
MLRRSSRRHANRVAHDLRPRTALLVDARRGASQVATNCVATQREPLRVFADRNSPTRQMLHFDYQIHLQHPCSLLRARASMPVTSGVGTLGPISIADRAGRQAGVARCASIVHAGDRGGDEVRAHAPRWVYRALTVGRSVFSMWLGSGLLLSPPLQVPSPIRSLESCASASESTQGRRRSLSPSK